MRGRIEATRPTDGIATGLRSPGVPKRGPSWRARGERTGPHQIKGTTGWPPRGTIPSIMRFAVPMALLTLSSVVAVAAPREEMRGLWVVRTGLVTPQAVDQVVEEARQGGFNALFVQVRGRGDAFYNSRIVARSAMLQGQPETFDPLARLLERAHGQGLDVHVWVNVLLSGHFLPLPANHVVSLHPEWLMVPRSAAEKALLVSPKALPWLVRQSSRFDADVEGYYLSPAAPGVPEYLEEVVRELVRGYPVQGIHLDFIRYPGSEYDYSPAALNAFKQQQGGGDLLGTPQANPAAWSHFLRSTLTALAERLARAARAERPGIVVSAAVVADETIAVTQRFQDWPSWLSQGILDAVCPMAYTADDRIFRQQVAQARSRTSGQPVWAGVGAYRLTLPGIVDHIRAARESGASGVVLFSHESLAPWQWKGLKAEAF
jgi:uncharacterized lipoprotein YddW (UPF0748 family)